MQNPAGSNRHIDLGILWTLVDTFRCLLFFSYESIQVSFKFAWPYFSETLMKELRNEFLIPLSTGRWPSIYRWFRGILVSKNSHFLVPHNFLSFRAETLKRLIVSAKTRILRNQNKQKTRLVTGSCKSFVTYCDSFGYPSAIGIINCDLWSLDVTISALLRKRIKGQNYAQTDEPKTCAIKSSLKLRFNGLTIYPKMDEWGLILIQTKTLYNGFSDKPKIFILVFWGWVRRCIIRPYVYDAFRLFSAYIQVWNLNP